MEIGDMDMSSKTKIIVLHLKELIYTGIFAVLGILFLILLIIMFLPGKSQAPMSSEADDRFVPGKYTTSVILGSSAVDVEVVVDDNNINSIRLVNLDEAVTTMYPLMEPALNDLAVQICEKQSLEDITYSDDNKYTSQVLLEAITSALSLAETHPGSINESDKSTGSEDSLQQPDSNEQTPEGDAQENEMQNNPENSTPSVQDAEPNTDSQERACGNIPDALLSRPIPTSPRWAGYSLSADFHTACAECPTSLCT